MLRQGGGHWYGTHGKLKFGDEQLDLLLQILSRAAHLSVNRVVRMYAVKNRCSNATPTVRTNRAYLSTACELLCNGTRLGIDMVGTF